MPSTDGVDYEGVARAMEVLANPNRLRVLRQLLAPRTVGEIELTPLQKGPYGSDARPVSRQGVRQHLDKLLEIGVIQVRDAFRASGPAQEFLVNHARLFALTEEFRKLGSLKPQEQWALETMAGARKAAKGPDEGARFLLVHGVGEGTAYPLAPDAKQWRIGRDAACEVPLDFDPFVSGENSYVTEGDEGFLLHDLPTSRNGTTLNWTPLPKGGYAPLRHGDLVGVGRSLLLFRT